MARFLPDLDSWPFAPGESPFTIKGTGYKGHVDYVEANVPGGMAAMRAATPDPRVAAFFEQPFLASTLYDVVPLILAAEPCGALTGQKPDEFARTRARDQAPKDLGGVYRFVLAMVPTGSVAKRLPQLLTQVFGFGSANVTDATPGRLDATIDGIPEALAPWMATILSAYGQTALRVSGAKEASFAVTIGERWGTAHGVPLVRYGIAIRYA